MKTTFNYKTITICGIFVYLLVLNFLLPPQSDDVNILLKQTNGIKAMIESYLGWNARIGELLFVGFVGNLPHHIFDFINAVVGIVFIITFFTILFAYFPKSKNDYFILCFILLLILYFAPFGADFLWVAGSLNYSWGILIIMFHLLPYRIFLQKAFSKNDKIQSPIILKKERTFINIIFLVFFSFLSFFGGMASEQLGIVCAILHLILLAIILKKQKRSSIPVWYYIGVIAFIIGFICLYLSPGHQARAAYSAAVFGKYKSITELLQLTLEDKVERILATIELSKTLGFKSLVFMMIYIYVNSFKYKYKILPYAIFSIISYAVYQIDNIFLYHLVFVGICVRFIKLPVYKIIFLLYVIFTILCLSGIQVLNIPPRSRLGDCMVIIGIFVILFNYYYANKNYIKKIIFGILIIYGSFVFIEYARFFIQWNNMLDFIEQQKNEGKFDIVVKNIFISHYRNFSDWDNPTDIAYEWPNTTYAQAFGIRTFRVEEFYVDIIQF